VADTLKAGLLDPDRRGQVVTDLQALVDQEVAGKSGLSGGIVKTGYAAIKKIKPGIVGRAVDGMLEEFVDALEPFWAAYRAQPTPGFGGYLVTRQDDASQALLAVTDRRAEKASSATRSAYGRLRPRAQENVAEALPRVGELIERHAL
jgi:hypothetical protein